MNNFTTITVPTVLAAQHASSHHEDTSKDFLPFAQVQQAHPRQAALMRKLFGVPEEKLASDPRPLRSQVEPTVKISLRRRVTDTLNSPFEYEMTEAARVVL